MRGHKINELAFGKTEVVTVLGDPLCESGDARALDDVSDLRVHGCLPWLWENRGRGRSAMRTLRNRIRWIAKSLLELLRRSEIGPLRASDRLKLRHRFARVIDIQRRLFRVLANGDRLANLGVPLVVSREGLRFSSQLVRSRGSLADTSRRQDARKRALGLLRT
jgi:hypothetical protein